MTERVFPLPLDLTEEDLPKIEIKYGLYSSKSGAGVEEVFLLGTGKVVLRRTASYNSPPVIVEGAISVEVIVRLIELFEDQRFFGLDEEHFADHPGLRRIVSVTTPTLSKRVAIDDEGGVQFERCVSALLFAASFGEPRVLERRFFQVMGPI